MAVSRRTTVVLVVGLVVVLAAATVVVLQVVRGGPRTDLQRAVALAPEDAARYSFTDWAAVRDDLDLSLDADSTTADVQVLLDRGFEADLTSTTALASSAQPLQAQYGFSPATLEWELFAQSETEAVVVMALPDTADDDTFADIARRLEGLGYAPPEEPDGVWEGDPGVITRAGSVTPELTFLALDSDRRLVLGSDTLEGARAGVEAVAAEETPGGGVEDVLADAGHPLSAAVYTGDQACVAFSMRQADPTDADEADELLAAAGTTTPLTGFAIGIQPGGDVRVSMAFETDELARTNADTRTVLASGPAPGQGGTFPERFTLGEVTAEGRVVRMPLEPVADNTFLLSDISTGPLVFAAC